MSKQTAVEWFVKKLIVNELIDVKNGYEFLHLQSKAKEMEKEQIITSYNEGSNQNGFPLKDEAELYYNETYKNIEK
jgi:hypothetical protein